MKMLMPVIVISVTVIIFMSCAKKQQPMKLISRDIPVQTNDDCNAAGPARFAVDSNYETLWRACKKPSENKPAEIIFDLSKVQPGQRKKVLLAWFNEYTSPYDHTLITAAPNPGYNNIADYEVLAENDSGEWVTLASVKGNTFHSRQHVLQLNGATKLKIKAMRSDGTKDNEGIAVNVDLYDASNGTDDNWLFVGDSITQMSMNHWKFACSSGKGSFSELIAEKKPAYFPLQENAGTGYMKSSDGAANMKKWLSMFPGKYVVISYGTNDAWGKMDPAEFAANYEVMIKQVLASGKTVIIPRTMPWSSTITDIQVHGEKLNAALKPLFRKYPSVKQGPDLWEFYKKNPSLLSQDGVHPSSPDGLFALRQLWADFALKKIY